MQPHHHWALVNVLYVPTKPLLTRLPSGGDNASLLPHGEDNPSSFLTPPWQGFGHFITVSWGGNLSFPLGLCGMGGG